MSTATPIDENAVKDLARRLWEKRGRPAGGPEMCRPEAERRIAAKRRAENQTVEEASKESFPASDPPASGVPDKPPVNAEEKWQAANKERRRKRGR